MIAFVLALLCWCLASVGAPAQNLLRNGDFALDADGDGMADGWHFAGDESVGATWARWPAPGGGYAQVLTCSRFTGHGPASHVMLAQQGPLALKGGTWYRVSFLAKGAVSAGMVSAAILQIEPWLEVGFHERLRVRDAWQRHEFTFRAARDVSTACRFQIWYTSTGTLWIGDVQLCEVAGPPPPRRYTETVPHLRSRNLLPNSSFECGTSGWGTIGRGVDWSASGLSTLVGRVDGTTAARHAHSFRIDLDRATAPVLAGDYYQASHFPVLAPLLANRGWIDVEPGQAYTFSAYLKATPAGVPCLMVVNQAFQGTLRQAVTAGADWQRVSFTFRPQAGQIFVGLGPDLTASELAKVTLWVDAVQLEEGEQATAYRPRAPVEIGLDWPGPGHLFASPQQARAALTAFNAGDRAQLVPVGAEVTDFWNRPAATLRCRLSVPARGATRRVVSLGVRDKGFYRFRLTSDTGAVVPVGVERFGVIDPCTDEAGVFGMNHAYPSAELQRLSKQIGLTWFRDWSLKWQHVEPEPGRLDFDEADYQVDRLRQAGLNVLGLLPFPSSEWSSTAPATVPPNADLGSNARVAYRPRNLDEWGTYVRAAARQYRGRIRVWEVLNEPLYTGYALPLATGHTMADYVALLRVAYQAVKEIDPEAIVVGGVAADPGVMTAELIAAGALQWLDAVNVHTYPLLQAPEVYLPALTAMNQAMAAAGHPKPIYFTEGAYYGDDDLPITPYTSEGAPLRPLDSELECASYQARFDLILLSQQVRKIIYHAGMPGSLNRPMVEGVFFEWDGAPRKMAVTQSVLTALLGPQPVFLGSVWDQPMAPRGLAFQGRDHTVVAAWDERLAGRILTPRPGVSLLDIAGAAVTTPAVRLGGTPYYIVIPGRLALHQAQARLHGWLK